MPVRTAVRTPRPARKEPTDTAGQLAHCDDEQKEEHQRPVLSNSPEIELHPHRHEENRREHVANRPDFPLDLAPGARLGDQTAGEEGAEGDRVAEGPSYGSHAKAETHTDQHHCLRPPMLRRSAHRAGNDQHARRQHDEQRQRETGETTANQRNRQGTGRGNRGENREQQDRREVLEDQHPEEEVLELPRRRLFFERLHDDHRAGNRYDSSREETGERGPPEEMADGIAQHQHAADFDGRGEPGGWGERDYLSHAELQPDAEHQQDDAQLRQSLDRCFVGDEAGRSSGTDQEAGQQVAKDNRQLEPLAGERRDRGGHQNDGKVAKKIVDWHSGRAGTAIFSGPAAAAL